MGVTKEDIYPGVVLSYLTAKGVTVYGVCLSLKGKEKYGCLSLAHGQFVWSESPVDATLLAKFLLKQKSLLDSTLYWHAVSYSLQNCKVYGSIGVEENLLWE